LIVDEDNAWVAGRDIEAGEELTMEYSCFFNDIFLIENCLCGTEKCRGRIGPGDCLRPEMIERYYPHYNAYILKLVQEHMGV